MPVRWEIDHAQQLITVIAEGNVKYTDIEAFGLASATEGALGYRKLVDFRNASAGLSEADLQGYAGMAAAYRTMSQLGPIAVVVREAGTSTDPLLMALAATPRPFMLFQEMERARQWLESFSPRPKVSNA